MISKRFGKPKKPSPRISACLGSKKAPRSGTRQLSVMPFQPPASPAMKILMLHGYTQSGPLFHAKTRALEKHLQKAFPGLTLSYPTGPMRLDPANVPGYDMSNANASDIEAYGWWRRSNTAEPPEYLGLDDGFSTIAKVIAAEGPFDGVIGFSQGACAAAMVASLLEGTSRQRAFEHFRSAGSGVSIPYPAAFESLEHPPLKFWVAYSGFAAPGERYKGFYDHPHIETPSCHVLGSLDTLVDEKRGKTLIDACGGEDHARVIWHPGGHFVPSGKQCLDALVDFIRITTSSTVGKKEAEESVEDMEVPF